MKTCLFLFIRFAVFGFTSNSQNDSNVVIALQKKAAVYDELRQTDSVLYYQNESLALSEKINYKPGIARSLSAIGIIHMHKGKYPEALGYFFRSLKIYEDIKNKEGILTQLGNIGIVYDYQEDYEKALDYYGRSLKISESINDKRHTSIQLCNIAIVYSNKGDFSTAKEFFFKALAIDRQRGDKEGVARNLANIGNSCSDQGDHVQALKYNSEALAKAEETGDKNLITSCLANMGSAYSHLKDFKKAETYLLRAIKEVESENDLNLKSQLELIISELYRDMKNDNKAFLHYRNHINLRDSVYNEENTRKSVRTEMNYVFEKKEAATKYEHNMAILKLETDNKLHKQFMFFLALVLVLLLVLLLFARRAYNAKKKAAEFMAAESARKELLLQEVHHRINNNLQIISGLLTLQANSLNDEKLTEYLKQSQNRIQSLSALHELLYQNDSPLQINMNQYLNKVLDYHRHVLSGLSMPIDLSVEVTDAAFPTKLAVPIALIVNELITNSIKYAFEGKQSGKIKISLLPFLDEKYGWVLSFSDNGKGLPPENTIRRESLGIRLINILTKQINGSLMKSNSPGATFDILFNQPI